LSSWLQFYITQNTINLSRPDNIFLMEIYNRYQYNLSQFWLSVIKVDEKSLKFVNSTDLHKAFSPECHCLAPDIVLHHTEPQCDVLLQTKLSLELTRSQTYSSHADVHVHHTYTKSNNLHRLQTLNKEKHQTVIHSDPYRHEAAKLTLKARINQNTKQLFIRIRIVTRLPN